MSTQLNWNVAGDPGDDTPVLIADNPPGGTTLETRFEGVEGLPPNRFVAIVPVGITGGATLYYQQRRKAVRVIVPPGEGSWEAGAPPCLPPELTPDDEALIYGPSLSYLPPLERRGQFYYRNGQPHTVIESSEFRLYERFLRGQDIGLVLDDRANLIAPGVGMNCLRVWMLNTSVGHILPWEWGDAFYDRIPEFLGLCGRYGVDVEFTVFTHPADMMPELERQQAHYDRIVGAVGDRFCFVEGCNEWDAYTANQPHPGLRYHKPAGATFDLCRGSNGSDSGPLDPTIDSSRYHSNDAPEWWRRQAHNGMEAADTTGKPNLANENTRPDRDPAAMSGQFHHYFDAAAGAALLSAGSCFHSNSGKDAVIYSGIDRPCAMQHVLGARRVDLSQRVFPYQRRDDLNGTSYIRVYQRGSAIEKIRP